MICPITNNWCRTNGCGEKCYKRDSLGYATAPQHDAKLPVRRRADINQEMAQKWELIAEIKSEIIALKKENLLLCDETQRFEETEEEVIISRRPKKTEKRLIGRIHWKEEFKDEDTGQSIWIERSQVVRVNGVWQ